MRSSLEVVITLLLRLLGLRENEDFFTNRRIVLEWFWVYPGRRKITTYEVDAFIPKYKIIIEVDGGRWHYTDEDKQTATTKKNNLTLSGYLLIRKTDKDLLGGYQAVLNEIERTLKRFEEPLFDSFQGEDKKLIWIVDKIIEKLKETPEKTIQELHDELGVAEVYVKSAMLILEKDGIVTSLLSEYSLTEEIPIKSQFTQRQAIIRLKRIGEWCIQEKKEITIDWQNYTGVLKSHRDCVKNDREVIQNWFGADILENRSILFGSEPKFDIVFRLRIALRRRAIAIQSRTLSSSLSYQSLDDTKDTTCKRFSL